MKIQKIVWAEKLFLAPERLHPGIEVFLQTKSKKREVRNMIEKPCLTMENEVEFRENPQKLFISIGKQSSNRTGFAFSIF